MRQRITIALIAVALLSAAAAPSVAGSHEMVGDDLLLVKNEEDYEYRARVLTIEHPSISADENDYALIGWIWHNGVEGKGYLEMLSIFPDGSVYFSRGLADSGPMRYLEGRSPFRQFQIPFHLKPGDPRPERLELYVVLPGKGSVWLAQMELKTQYPDGGTDIAHSGHWWSNRQAGLFGGVTGAVVGCLGALIGVIGGCGVARRFVTGLLCGLAGCGVALNIAGVVAVVGGQPYHVYYPLLLLGLPMILLSLALLLVMTRRYAQIELRKMSAMDKA